MSRFIADRMTAEEFQDYASRMPGIGNTRGWQTRLSVLLIKELGPSYTRARISNFMNGARDIPAVVADFMASLADAPNAI